MRLSNIPLLIALSTTPILATAQTALSPDLKQAIHDAYQTNNVLVMTLVLQQIATESSDAHTAARNYIVTLKKQEERAKIAEEKKIAASSKPKETKKYSGKIEGGAGFETGNTESETVNLGAELHYNFSPKIENITTAKAVNSKENDVRNAEEYRLDNQTRYNLTDKDYAFLELGFVNDRFSGFEYRIDELVGYGRRLIKTNDMTLNGEISAGARQTSLTNGDKESSVLGKVSTDFDWTINQYLSFEQELAATLDSETTIINSDSGLKARMTDALYLKLGVEIENISDVPDGKESTDTRTTVSVGYDF